MPNLTFINRYLYGLDERYYLNQTNNFRDGIFRVSYNNWFPFKKFQALKKWEIIPMYKMERWKEQAFKEDYRELLGDWRKDAFALVLQNRLTEKTRLFIGEQVVVYNDMLNNNDSTRCVFATEIVHDDRYYDRPLLVTAGVKFVNQSAPKPENEQMYEHLYLKAYFIW